MKIKDILGEAGAVATIKDYKPGQTLSFSDPTGATMTTIDLKKNPMAVKPDAQGNLTYDPTPDTQAEVPGQSSAPEIKPGAQIQIDTATTEGHSDNFKELFGDWMSSEYAPMDDESGDEKAVFIKALNFVADRMDNRSDSETYAYKLADMFHGSGMPDEEEEVQMPSRMDESAYITTLAKRISNAETKSAKTSDKSVFDIKRLAGL